MLGGAGDDTYRYLQGGGYDTLTDTSGSDTLSFDDIELSTAHFYKIGNELEVDLGGGQGVLINNQFANSSAPTVDFMLFGGTSLTAAQLAGMAGPKP